MQCHCYFILSTTGGGDWIVAAENDDRAIASLPAEHAPYKIIRRTAPVELMPFSEKGDVHIRPTYIRPTYIRPTGL